MKKTILFISILLVPLSILFAQEFDEKSHIINGNEQYNKGDYLKAESQYKVALSKNENSIKGNFNLGNALYHQNKFDEARAHYDRVIQNLDSDEISKAEAYHNIGKSYLDQNEFEKAMNNFKEALKLDPHNDQTRYNYALAKKRLEEESEKDKPDNENPDENDDAGDDKENQDSDKEKDGKEQSEDDKDGDSQKDQQSDEQDRQGNQSGGQDGQEKGQGDRPEDVELTRGEEGKGAEEGQSLNQERQETMLKALQQQEQESFRKIINQKADKSRTRADKDW